MKQMIQPGLFMQVLDSAPMDIDRGYMAVDVLDMTHLRSGDVMMESIQFIEHSKEWMMRYTPVCWDPEVVSIRGTGWNGDCRLGNIYVFVDENTHEIPTTILKFDQNIGERMYGMSWNTFGDFIDIRLPEWIKWDAKYRVRKKIRENRDSQKQMRFNYGVYNFDIGIQTT
jgi:hypothetical protein